MEAGYCLTQLESAVRRVVHRKTRFLVISTCTTQVLFLETVDHEMLGMKDREFRYLLEKGREAARQRHRALLLDKDEGGRGEGELGGLLHRHSADEHRENRNKERKKWRNHRAMTDGSEVDAQSRGRQANADRSEGVGRSGATHDGEGSESSDDSDAVTLGAGCDESASLLDEPEDESPVIVSDISLELPELRKILESEMMGQLHPQVEDRSQVVGNAVT